MTTVNLKEFLRTGQFGPVTFGMHQDQVINILGQPDDTSIPPRRKRRPDILKYGTMELHFDDQADYKLFLIFADHLEHFSGGNRLELDPWVLRGHLSRPEVEDALRQAEISFSEFTPLSTDLEGIRTEAGVELTFVLDPAENELGGGFFSISLLTNLPSTIGPRRTVSFEIPLSDYEKIRKEAIRRRIKISKLCSEWLQKEASHLPG